jgi:hypothetical protein
MTLGGGETTVSFGQFHRAARETRCSGCIRAVVLKKHPADTPINLLETYLAFQKQAEYEFTQSRESLERLRMDDLLSGVREANPLRFPQAEEVDDKLPPRRLRSA